jgi:hypothetical protein
MKMFAQITKVDEAKRLVYGRAVQEVPDRADEIFDYAKSKPHFEEWSKSFESDTDGKSLGNLRAMHGKTAAGKLTAISFNDAEKAIDICGKVVDDNEWNKVLEGVYTGFSIGGAYVGEKTTEKVDNREIKRYTARPSEISLVDSPCIPTAKFFEIVKVDGTLAKVDFKKPAIEVTGTDDEVAEFAKVLNDGGLSMADAIGVIRKAADAKKLAAPAPADKKVVDKGMWNVQDFASALSMLSGVAMSAQSDADWEGDKSPVPAKLRDWLAAGVKIFKAMADEETAELLAELKTQAGEPVFEQALRIGALTKRLADPDLTLIDLMKIAEEHLSAEERKPLKTPDDVCKAVLAKAKLSTANMDRLQAAHDHLSAMGADCSGEKKAPTGDLSKDATIKQLSERIEKLEKQPMPHPLVTLRTVKREDDGPAPVAKDVPEDLSDVKLEPADYVKNADGSIDYATSRLMKAHKLRATA